MMGPRMYQWKRKWPICGTIPMAEIGCMGRTLAPPTNTDPNYRATEDERNLRTLHVAPNTHHDRVPLNQEGSGARRQNRRALVRGSCAAQAPVAVVNTPVEGLYRSQTYTALVSSCANCVAVLRPISQCRKLI